tara:strand:+ start:8032 stop:10719 length:2688 start_codon:yes stop_codon:yes gene_type:complete
MATFVNDLRLTELATGEGSGTWGETTNTNLELIAEAFSFGTEAITTNADTHTTTIADGSTDAGRSIFLKYTGTLDSACTITIGPNTVSKLWLIENATSGSQNIIIKQGSGATVTVPNGQTKAIYSDGAGSGGAMVDAFQDLSIPDLFIDDDLTFTSDSAVITFGADGDTTLTHTDGSGLTLNSTNKLMFNDASQFIQGSSATVLSLGATDEIDLTATAIDINGTADISSTLTVGGATRINADFSVSAASGEDRFAILPQSAGSGSILFSGNSDLTAYEPLVVDFETLALRTSGTARLEIGTSGGTTITVTDNSDTLTLVSTDADANVGPVLNLFRDSASPADNDLIGRIVFKGDDDAGNAATYARIETIALDVSNGSEDGRLDFYTAKDDAFSAAMSIASNNVGIGQTSPDTLLHLAGADTAVIRLENTDTSLGSNQVIGGVEFEKTDGSGAGAGVVGGMRMKSDGSVGEAAYLTLSTSSSSANDQERLRINGDGKIRLGNSSDHAMVDVTGSNAAIQLIDNNQSNPPTLRGNGPNFTIENGGHELFKINSTTEVVVNEASQDTDFRVESNNNTHMLFVNGEHDVVTIGGTTVETGDHLEVLSADSNTNVRIRNTNAGSGAPVLLLDKHSDSPADNDDVGEIRFIGKDSAGNAEQFAGILVESADVTSGTEDGRITIQAVVAGTYTSMVQIDSGQTLFSSGTSTIPSISFISDPNTGFQNNSADNIGFVIGGSQKAFMSASQFNMTGNGVFSGSISKGSGSFKIDHPLPAKTDTHHLVHSFVEAPQADNIYRGSVDLVGGSATVNIDTAAGMTDGTFVLLNTNVQCFTSNESGWTAIKGSVSGNTLTITAQDNTCTDTISWMVVGERHDQHMKDTEWTDSDGKVIVEPEKTSEGE